MIRDQHQECRLPAEENDPTIDGAFVSAFGSFLHNVVDDIIIPKLTHKLQKAFKKKPIKAESKDQLGLDL